MGLSGLSSLKGLYDFSLLGLAIQGMLGRKISRFLGSYTTLIFFFRLEWESAILRGCSSFRRMEDDRLNQLRYLAEQYQQILDEHRPKLVSNAHRLDEPIRRIHVSRDMEVVRKKVINPQNIFAIFVGRQGVGFLIYFDLGSPLFAFCRPHFL